MGSKFKIETATVLAERGAPEGRQEGQGAVDEAHEGGPQGHGLHSDGGLVRLRGPCVSNGHY